MGDLYFAPEASPTPASLILFAVFGAAVVVFLAAVMVAATTTCVYGVRHRWSLRVAHVAIFVGVGAIAFASVPL